MALITGSGCRKFPSKVNPTGWTDISRNQLLKWVKNGEIAIVVGTHALIQKSVQFKHLAFAIIDEQHRFGVNQRKALVRRKDADKTQMSADTNTANELNNELLYKDLTYRIRTAVFKVANELGLGHKEIIYQKALAEEFASSRLAFSREKQIPIYYQKKKVGTYQPDFVVDDKIIVELKALPFTGSREKKQLWGYLKGSEFKLALLVNFSPEKVDIQRIIYQTARLSASHPRESACYPHLLSMTATPIPRTLALTIYGDLDLTVLDEQPPGRKPIITEPVAPKDRDATYEKIRKELQAGRQCYIITPRIDEPDPDKEFAVQARSAKAEAKRLQEKVFPEYVIGVMHSKLKDTEKERVMEEFKDGKIHILVSTSVVEVGVNVPNATVIIIEGAERFGLSQLHQLRGRVLRSSHQAYCYVFTESMGAKTVERLHALKTAKNGFELAEYDLKFRGAGELSGSQQWGVSDVAMEALQNLKMVEAARAEAKRLLEEDESLSRYPLLQQHLTSRKKEEIHFE
ncbi:MAG: ATP-dependent DNA helicase RecG [Parcubacteria group bacterium GW2011_GWA2_49_9]|nr:MAG: ATP-dependent DNA helicase RecG [Parcubacteria group bacterium GW2011_GWA2_49_9]